MPRGLVPSSPLLPHAGADRGLHRRLARRCRTATAPVWRRRRRPRTLGRTALLGGRVWSRQHKFRIVIGPLPLADYLRLLPGGASFHRLIPIVRNYAGDTLIWDVNLILKREEVPPTRLGDRKTGGRARLDHLAHAATEAADAADLYLDASADSMRAPSTQSCRASTVAETAP